MTEVFWGQGSKLPHSILPTSLQGFEPGADHWPPGSTEHRCSAVAVLFASPLEGESRATIILTRRSTKVRTHKGQIGFAGGRVEPQDTCPNITALRELEEELGISPGDVSVHGVLSILSALDASPVVPVVATTSVSPSKFRLCPDEVDSLVLAPWDRFLASRSRPFEFNLFGNWRRSHLFDLSGQLVWGLTAQILYNADMK